MALVDVMNGLANKLNQVSKIIGGLSPPIIYLRFDKPYYSFLIFKFNNPFLQIVDYLLF